MGRLIVCQGRQTVAPYYYKITNTKVYSIEELCYYIFTNIEILNKGFFGYPLCDWIEEELELPECADKLRKLLDADAMLADLVEVVLCSNGYYTDGEIRQILRYIGEMERLTPFQKKKKKADNYLRYRQFTEAETEYKQILGGTKIGVVTAKEYGDILHNLAVVQLNTVGVAIAATTFKEAYEKNQNVTTLKFYLLALKLSKAEERYQQEIEAYQVDHRLLDEIQSELDEGLREAEQSEEYKVVNTLREYKSAGRITHFYQAAEDIVEHWKIQYRRENA
ncbi:MAG: hypothetical protein K0R21_1388 [Anaerocolumna sp.]|jgi:tetratricopeptide (TPR) repeat protein|nr:hypothetical protein [Anaerocolumna sp.]